MRDCFDSDLALALALDRRCSRSRFELARGRTYLEAGVCVADLTVDLEADMNQADPLSLGLDLPKADPGLGRLSI